MRVRWSRLRVGIAGLVLTLLVGGAVLVITREATEQACGAAQVASPRSPLQSVATMARRPVELRDRTVAAVGAMGPPFGPVVAGAEDYYDQRLRLFAVPGGLLAWSKNDAPVTFLDEESLEPRWSLRPTSQRTAWDVSPDRFLLANLADDQPVTWALFDLQSARPVWCVEAAASHRDGDPVSSAFLQDGDVATALPSGNEVTVQRLGAAEGQQRWMRQIAGADRADYLGPLTDEVLLVGGSEEYLLTQVDPPEPRSGGPVLTALDAADGRTLWTWAGGPGSRSHVVGTVDGTAVVMLRTGGRTELVSLADDGGERWRTRLPAGGREATLRGQVVVTRADAGLSGYDAVTGKRLWFRRVPIKRPYLPLGFTLAQMPSVDADHLLMPTVASVELLDLADGTSTSYPLPTDGLSSAFFAYQLLASTSHLGILTNTAVVIAQRE